MPKYRVWLHESYYVDVEVQTEEGVDPQDQDLIRDVQNKAIDIPHWERNLYKLEVEQEEIE